MSALIVIGCVVLAAVLIFGFTALHKAVLSWTIDNSERWWSLPLWMSYGLCVAAPTMVGSVFGPAGICIALLAGAR